MKEIHPQEHIDDDIGFTFVKQSISNFCSTDEAKRKALLIKPFGNFQELKHRLNEVQEYSSFAAGFRKGLHFKKTEEITRDILKSETNGYVLDLESIVVIYDFLQVAIPVFKKLNNYENLRFLSSYIHPTHPLQEIEISIGKVVSANGLIKPNASRKLAKLLQKEEDLKAQIWKVLQSVYKSLKQKKLTAEDEPRLSNGRYVIPVKSAQKASVSGVLQGKSGSQNISYIEPFEVIEANNELNLVDIEITEEINEILKELSGKIGVHAQGLLHAQKKMVKLDMLNGVYTFSKEFNANVPVFNTEGKIDLKNCLHPQLVEHLKQSGDKMNPLTFQFTKEKRMMIISGPNAGGKSVALKTVSLAVYMAHCGLPVCSEEKANITFMSSLLTDVGDNQSMDDDLSTYSAHLKSMNVFLRSKAKNAFVAIDEIGAGTDPLLGGPMAEAMIEEFNAKGYYGVITTHFSNLKSLELEYVFNASMLYDMKALEPLYILSIGSPGSSFVFELARRMKLPNRLIQKAKSLSNTEQSNLEELLTTLDSEKVIWQKKSNELKQKEAKLQNMLQEYEQLKSNLVKEKKAILNSAKQEAQWILKDANKAIENTVRSIKEGQAKKELVQQERKKIEKKKENLEKVETKTAIKPKKVKVPEKIVWKVGDWASIDNETQAIEILKIKNNKAEVVHKNIRTTVPLKRLFPAKKASGSNNNHNIYQHLMGQMSDFNSKLDIRGKRLEEGKDLIQKFMDGAFTLGIKEVSIVHGKGDGALRKATREYLKTLSFVESWKYEHADRGGQGVSHIVLK